MLEEENLCDCIKGLKHIGLISKYFPPYNTLADNYTAEEGQLCIVNEVMEDYGYYDEYSWVSNIVCYKELYPINYCPVCGKKIEYKKSNRLVKR